MERMPHPAQDELGEVFDAEGHLNSIFVSHDQLMKLEDEYWDELEAEVEQNVISQEEAERRFVNWRRGLREFTS